MTNTLPPITLWHTDSGIALAVTRPDAGPDDTATVVALPVDYVLSEFLPAVLAALDGHAQHRALIDAVNTAIIEGSLDDE